MSQSDIHPVINPVYWTTEELISYGHDTIHELAINAAGTVNSYQVVLGRCLLAVERTKLYEAFGCSGAVHYGTQVLGLTPKQARAMRRVAHKLETLPLFSRAAEVGELNWSVLREVLPKVTPETEAYWLALCRQKNCHQIAKLLRHTPVGGLPGDLPEDGDKEPAISELRLSLKLSARTVVERGLQAYSLEQGRPVPLAEAVEMLFAKLLQKESSSQTELDVLSQSQEEARKDIWADHCRREPLLKEARELAEAMGLIEDPADFPLGNINESSSAPFDTDISLQQIAEALLESAAVETTSTTHGDARPMWDVSDREEAADLGVQDLSGPIEDPQWEDLLQAHQVTNPGNDNVVLLANDWRNRRLRFNEDARLPTTAQRREMLRRDGYCCSTPGCPNHLWLETHHIVEYSRKGKTISKNLVTLCSRCHKNVHRGHLRITGQAPDQLIFTDRHGHDLRRTHGLAVAGWLDYWCGWEGGPEDSHQHRWGRGESFLENSSCPASPPREEAVTA